MRVSLSATVTVMETRAKQVRRGAKLADGKTIRSILEKITDDNRPIIVEIYGVKEDRLPGDYFMRECRGLFIYEGAAYKELEKTRRDEKERDEKVRLRDVELNRIKTRLRAELKADDKSFDKKYDAQTKERVEITEREIEKKALAILAKEEGTDKC